MDKRLLAVVAAILLMGVAGYHLLSRRAEPPPAPVAAAGASPAATPSHRYPVAASTLPLPPLEASDAAFGAALAQALGLGVLPDYLRPERMIGRIVATVDNLPRARTSSRLMPMRPVPGRFAVTGGEAPAIARANALRYRAYIALAERADVAALVDLYLQWYPLFQQAYVQLGYPKGHFNDRLVEALDDMLGAPEAPVGAALRQPHVLYEFADPELEQRSAGQKIMLRMGEANAARVKTVLRALRGELVRRAEAVPR